jgi:hypothetical protein
MREVFSGFRNGYHDIRLRRRLGGVKESFLNVHNLLAHRLGLRIPDYTLEAAEQIVLAGHLVGVYRHQEGIYTRPPDETSENFATTMHVLGWDRPGFIQTGRASRKLLYSDAVMRC